MANSKQFVQRALAGQSVPRLPTGPLAVHFTARNAGVSLRDYSSKSQVLADCVLRYYERFRPDAIWLSADTWVTAQAMGASVGSIGDDQPFGGLSGPFIETAADLDRIPKPDPSTQGRYPMMLEALQRVVLELGSEVYIVACFDQYPFSLAAALLGINELMLKLGEDLPLVEAVMEKGLEYALAYGEALGALGADLLSGGDAPAGLIGPKAYRRVALPYEQRLTASLKSAANKPVSLHICGAAQSILADMACSGADVLEIDHQVDLAFACNCVSPEIALWGNLDPVGLIAQSRPERIREAARQAERVVRSFGRNRFVLSSGCTLAVETPAENLRALLEYDATPDGNRGVHTYGTEAYR